MNTGLKTLLSQDDSNLCTEQLREYINLQATRAAMELMRERYDIFAEKNTNPTRSPYSKERAPH